MGKSNRKFALEEKHQILREGENNGIEVTSLKYGIMSSLYYVWKDKFDLHGADGLLAQYHRVDSRIKALEKKKEWMSSFGYARL